MLSTEKERARYLRAHVPDVREEFFEMQNRICDLCGYPIQDLILADLDHSVPVMTFARADTPIEEANRLCNALSNLRAAHSSCNIAKGSRTRDEWFILGLSDRSKPRYFSERDLEDFRKRAARCGVVAASRRTPEQRSEFARRAAVSYIARTTFEQRSATAKVNSDKLPREERVRIGREAYLKLDLAARLELALAGAAASSHARTKEWHSAGGRAKAEKYPDQNRTLGARLNHRRWHVARQRFNPSCPFCAGEGS